MPRGRPRGSTAAAAPRAVRARTAQALEFTQSLVLNQWLFGLFGLESIDGWYRLSNRRVPLLEAFKQRFQINEHSEEGLDENNIHRFHHALINQITGELPGVSRDELLAFDQNIVRHTLALNAQRALKRERPVVWKYYQYLSLLFVEIYLDRYFRDPQALAAALNAHIMKFNEGKDEAEQLPLMDEGRDAALGLNKLALWCATGSGKTLLMHVNLHQYQHHLAQAGRAGSLNRILLLTPNEGLSQQHLEEFTAAGIEAELFDKNARGLFAGRAVEIIDIHKLADEMGDKTVAVDAFESGNLVLVDEGHRGTSGGEAGKWLTRRDQLCEKGFSFEYSATFKQAVRPVALNDGEMRFVTQLKDYCEQHPKEFADRPLFLLRNLSRGRGVGFFEAGNFYPDFMLWRLDGDRQRITFVDPKGIRNLSWQNEPKLDFYRTIKDIEARLQPSDPSITLESYIVSVTSAAEMALHWNVTHQDLADRHILFEEDIDYIRRLLA